MDKIDIIPWNDNFNTGIASIDKQHKKLVDIINELATQFAYNSNNIDINNIFDELIDYTNYHFDSEEFIWNKYFNNHTKVLLVTYIN
jgi:hemerythrin-like metal-binding protein